ncbi:hypothetical protein FOQG_19581 [Fusarium oxysporum f. sp. raphani 54005]|uniref:Uncharacterized protein n=1 Tax=Fusarium oxysporum f. sp. raphani 54005 TaxID=1089458 RepID=X0BYN8_FUSOX|nr:hypothetical protein FOQG_19581 [Fusarium oxysporum f. sp. raphani 54005]
MRAARLLTAGGWKWSRCCMSHNQDIATNELLTRHIRLRKGISG